MLASCDRVEGRPAGRGELATAAGVCRLGPELHALGRHLKAYTEEAEAILKISLSDLQTAAHGMQPVPSRVLARVDSRPRDVHSPLAQEPIGDERRWQSLHLDTRAPLLPTEAVRGTSCSLLFGCRKRPALLAGKSVDSTGGGSAAARGPGGPQCNPVGSCASGCRLTCSVPAPHQIPCQRARARGAHMSQASRCSPTP